jgi:hypothetical protein
MCLTLASQAEVNSPELAQEIRSLAAAFMYDELLALLQG